MTVERNDRAERPGPSGTDAAAATPKSERVGERALHIFTCLTAAATFVLVCAGALVTSTGSALSVPDWPLSYGSLFPPMVGGVRFEHSHRLIAGTVAILTLVLAAWLWRREPRRWVRRLGYGALGAVFLQALLGGITVLTLLPPPVSVAHACLGQTFFCLVVMVAVVTSPRWRTEDRGRGPAPAASRTEAGEIPPGNARTESTRGKGAALPDRGRHARLPIVRLALATFGVVYVQLVLGAIMRHTGSGLAIPDFPLSFGHLLPPEWSGHIAIHFAHRVWALVVTGFVATLAVRIARDPFFRPVVGRFAAVLSVLVPVQIGLGAMTVLSFKQAVLTSAHVGTGALILVTSLALAIRMLHAASLQAGEVQTDPHRVGSVDRVQSQPSVQSPATAGH